MGNLYILLFREKCGAVDEVEEGRDIMIQKIPCSFLSIECHQQLTSLSHSTLFTLKPDHPSATQLSKLTWLHFLPVLYNTTTASYFQEQEKKKKKTYYSQNSSRNSKTISQTYN